MPLNSRAPPASASGVLDCNILGSNYNGITTIMRQDTALDLVGLSDNQMDVIQVY